MIFYAEDPLADLQDSWRERLTEAQQRYSESRNGETRTEYLRVLRIFTDLVSNRRVPSEQR
jgi:hypothetical protein